MFGELAYNIPTKGNGADGTHEEFVNAFIDIFYVRRKRRTALRMRLALQASLFHMVFHAEFSSI